MTNTPQSVHPPMFSIVIAVLDAQRTIGRCIDSILDQTYRDSEIVVIDGGSSDGTQHVLERYDERIAYWTSEKDRGICHAWNKALKHVRGEWVIFLGADDRLARHDVLARVADRLVPGPPRVAYGVVNIVDERGTVLATDGAPWEETRPTFFDHNTVPHQAVFHHRTLFERNGLFDERFRICGDYELLLRELKDHEPVFIPNVTIADVAFGGLSTLPSSGYRATREMHRARYRHGLTKAPEWLSFRVLRATGYELLRRAFGPQFARSVADAYKSLTGG